MFEKAIGKKAVGLRKSQADYTKKRHRRKRASGYTKRKYRLKAAGRNVRKGLLAATAKHKAREARAAAEASSHGRGGRGGQSDFQADAKARRGIIARIRDRVVKRKTKQGRA